MQITHTMKLFDDLNRQEIFDGYVVRLSDSSFSIVEKKDIRDVAETDLVKFFSLQDIQNHITVPSIVRPLH